MAIARTDHEVVGKELLPKGKRDYTKFTLHENGAPLIRRSHALLIQAKNGQVFLLEGPDLPLSVTLFTGIVQGGRNLLQILLDPNSEEGSELIKALGSQVPTAPATGWPTARAVTLFLAGFVVHAMWAVQHELLMLLTR